MIAFRLDDPDVGDARFLELLRRAPETRFISSIKHDRPNSRRKRLPPESRAFAGGVGDLGCQDPPTEISARNHVVPEDPLHGPWYPLLHHPQLGHG